MDDEMKGKTDTPKPATAGWARQMSERGHNQG
jgi:hypothetical protein